MPEIAARAVALADLHVAAKQHGGHELTANRRVPIHFVSHEATQQQGALGVSDQDEAAAAVVVGQVLAPRR